MPVLQNVRNIFRRLLVLDDPPEQTALDFSLGVSGACPSFLGLSLPVICSLIAYPVTSSLLRATAPLASVSPTPRISKHSRELRNAKPETINQYHDLL